jgi:hypothetical protein
MNRGTIGYNSLHEDHTSSRTGNQAPYSLSSADTVEASTDPMIRIRPPVANSISTVPACSDDGAGRDEVAGSGTRATTTGLNAAGVALSTPTASLVNPEGLV